MKLTYLDLAENSYYCIEDQIKFIENHNMKISNDICINIISCIEKFLKHIININMNRIKSGERELRLVLASNNLWFIGDFINKNFDDITINIEDLKIVGSYYKNIRYPSETVFFIEKSDIDICWRVLRNIREQIIKYINKEN